MMAALERLKQYKACFVLGSNIDASQLSDPEVIHAYKGQSHVEGGFRFLKDPLFFVSSLFVKKPCRIQGLLMVMTLCLVGLLGGATPTAPAISTPPRDGAEPN